MDGALVGGAHRSGGEAERFPRGARAGCERHRPTSEAPPRTARASSILRRRSSGRGSGSGAGARPYKQFSTRPAMTPKAPAPGDHGRRMGRVASTPRRRREALRVTSLITVPSAFSGRTARRTAFMRAASYPTSAAPSASRRRQPTPRETSVMTVVSAFSGRTRAGARPAVPIVQGLMPRSDLRLIPAPAGASRRIPPTAPASGKREASRARTDTTGTRNTARVRSVLAGSPHPC